LVTFLAEPGISTAVLAIAMQIVIGFYFKRILLNFIFFLFILISGFACRLLPLAQQQYCLHSKQANKVGNTGHKVTRQAYSIKRACCVAVLLTK